VNYSKQNARRACALLTVGMSLLSLVGCSSIGVKPWEHDLLSKPSMQWESDGVDAAIDDHVYFSKEASTGGRTFGGGGCGCN
jgi:hypothetical protein